MPTTFQVTYPIAFHMTDMAGIVHFSEFFRWMEMAEHRVLKHLNIPPYLLEQDAFTGFPRVEAKCKYSRPLKFPGNVVMELKISSRDSRRIEYEIQFFPELDKEQATKPAAVGMLKTVLAKRDPGESAIHSSPMPEDWLEKLDQAINADKTIVLD